MFPIIGLEIHLELDTESKAFCPCSTEIWESPPNTKTCPICLGLPGSMPVLNSKAVEYTIQLAQALKCKINNYTFFERKNYFYPDLPKGFQISQKKIPLAQKGQLKIKGEQVKIREVHLEEDTAKSTHIKDATLIDFNKSGIPLVEVITEPCLDSVEVVDGLAKELQIIVQTLGVSKGDMEKGQMRFEANISIAESQDRIPDYRVEIKNLNSFKSLRDSLEYEIERQKRILEQGKKPVQQTRGWDGEQNRTFVQRVKEYAKDYRYFPEPDLPPLEIPQQLIEELKDKLPQLPYQKREEFLKMGLKLNQARILAKDPKRERYFRKLSQKIESSKAAKLVINQPQIMEKTPKEVVEMLKQKQEKRIEDRKVLSQVVEKIIQNNPQPVKDFRQGKKQALEFLVGQVMKRTQARADPELTRKILQEKL